MKMRIETMGMGRHGMEHFLDNIIFVSLKAGDITKFRRFVEVLMESGDSKVMSIAANLGK